jgi:NADH-quinone oxidoreductase subunit C
MTTAPHIDTHLDLPGLQALHKHLAAKFPKAQATLAVRELTLTIQPAQLIALLTFLRDDPKCLFTQLIDVCGADYLGARELKNPTRFAVVYHLLSMAHNQRIRVKVLVEEGATIPTATGLFPAAGWYERETYDMYGIVFAGHPDLRRILTDYGFVGFPLRKDFPLEGHVEVYYDATEKRVAYKPVDLPQEFRHFDRISEWSGMTGNTGLADSDNTFTKEEFK